MLIPHSCSEDRRILAAHRAGLLRREHLLPNIVSDVIFGVLALPLAMAFAIFGRQARARTVYTSIVAGLLVSAFGGTRLQIAVPTGAFIVILSGITAKYGIDGLQIAPLMAGCILLLLGLIRMERSSNPFPIP